MHIRIEPIKHHAGRARRSARAASVQLAPEYQNCPSVQNPSTLSASFRACSASSAVKKTKTASNPRAISMFSIQPPKTFGHFNFSPSEI
jgi:hypothetical protein